MALRERKSRLGPQTDDELDDWIFDSFGVRIPRQSVCETHQAPFTLLADMFFERTLAAVAMANRGGSKTYIAAMWHLLNSKFKRKCEGLSVGAIEQQAIRAYQNLQGLIKTDRSVTGDEFGTVEDNPEIEKSVMRETVWKNGSKVEIVPGTISAVNGPHNQKVHFDEVELADPQVYQESRNISQTRHGIKAQDLITSTRKRAHGQMQAILDEITESERQGMQPPYKLYTWCIFECAQNKPGCQHTNPDAPECDCPGDCDIAEHRCNCDRVAKGKWESGLPRTFKDVCQGRLNRSKGWIPLHDVHKLFRQSDRNTWEAQQECSKPSTAGLVLSQFDRVRHGIRWWIPDPSLGPIYLGVDFGGTNAHAVEWVQVIANDMDVYGYHQIKTEEPKKRIKAGTRIVFDEIYRAEIGNNELATMVNKHNRDWKRLFPYFNVNRIFADVQAKAARLDWSVIPDPAMLSGKLTTSSFTTKDVKAHVNYFRELVEDDLLVVDVTRCPMLIEECESWHYPEKKLGVMDDPDKPVEDFDHAVAAMRYLISNLRTLERRGNIFKGKVGSSEKGFGKATLTGSGPSRYLPKNELNRTKYHEMI